MCKVEQLDGSPSYIWSGVIPSFAMPLAGETSLWMFMGQWQKGEGKFLVSVFIPSGSLLVFLTHVWTVPTKNLVYINHTLHLFVGTSARETANKGMNQTSALCLVLVAYD